MSGGLRHIQPCPTFADMSGSRSQIDVINEILEDCLVAFPVHGLLIGLYQQYGKRGFLTKKQLRALHTKASQVPDMAPARLATLEAIIRKMPNRFRSELPKTEPKKDETAELLSMTHAILQKYPQHKRVLFFKSKLDSRNPLTSKEIEELKKFFRMIAG